MAATREWRWEIRSTRSAGTSANSTSHAWHMLHFSGKPSQGSLAIVRAQAGQTRSAAELADDSRSGLVNGIIDLFQGERGHAELVLSEGHDSAQRSGSRDEQFNYLLFLAEFERARHRL